jgi:hypothetical protein
VQPGNFNLDELPPPGTQFDKWICYNGTTGVPLSSINPANVPVNAGESITCVAKYSELPKLSLLSQLPPEYPTSSATANVAANSGNDTCIKNPSTRMLPPLTAAQSAAGQCATTSYVQPGTYGLTQTAPPGTELTCAQPVWRGSL